MLRSENLVDSTFPTRRQKLPSNIKYVNVTSGVFEIPLDNDGSLSLNSLTAQLPGASGLWYSSDDATRRKAIRYDRERNKLLPPDNGWKNTTYHVSYSNMGKGAFLDEQEMIRYEKASRVLYDSVETLSRLAQSGALAQSKITAVKPGLHRLKASAEKAASSESIPQTRPHEELRTRCIMLEETVIKKDKAFSDVQDNNATLQKELAEKAELVRSMEKKLNDADKALVVKSNELSNLTKNLDKTKREFDYLARPVEGFGDPLTVKDTASLKKQLDDAKWRCGELEASLHTKNREAVALRDWKREAEQTINRLQNEHSICNSRKEKHEATIHVLHQFAMLMKRELEKRAGLEPGFKPSIISSRSAFEDAEERIRRFEKDLDVARDNMCSQAEELSNWKWKCSELESRFTAKDNENKLILMQSSKKEIQLMAELNALKNELKAIKDPMSNRTADPVQSDVMDDNDDDEVENTLSEPIYEENITDSNNSELNE